MNSILKFIIYSLIVFIIIYYFFRQYSTNFWAPIVAILVNYMMIKCGAFLNGQIGLFPSQIELLLSIPSIIVFGLGYIFPQLGTLWATLAYAGLFLMVGQLPM